MFSQLCSSPPNTHFFSVLQQSPGFPEIDPDAHLDWHSQASGETSTTQPSTATDAEANGTFSFHQQPQSSNHASSLTWESAGLLPRLQLPALAPQDKPTPHLLGPRASPPSSPSDMPSGPSIATARVRHPLSSTESAALTQLRAELAALFVESQNGPDLSLVPLPRQLNQASTAKATSDAARTVKMVRPNRLQARPAATTLRRNSRRRYTVDTATANHAPQPQPAQAPQQLLTHAELTHPEPHQHATSHAAACQGVESQPAEVVPLCASKAFGAGVLGIAAGAVQSSSKGRRRGRSNSWAAGSTSVSGPTRVGVTQSGTASTSYSK